VMCNLERGRWFRARLFGLVVQGTWLGRFGIGGLSGIVSGLCALDDGVESC